MSKYIFVKKTKIMVYQIKITLEGSKPPIWRRIEVLPETTLEDFHLIIQTTMGWYNGHLHQYIVGNEYYSPPNEWDDFGNDYTGVLLKDFLQKEGQKIRYEYDFGDSWLHKIQLEKIVKKENDIVYPRCIKGKRACPPEDCGGIYGYMELEEIMMKKKGARYHEMLEWLGGELEPEKFDMQQINKELSSDNFGFTLLEF